MANRRFEMHEFRHILSRMRLGETDRQLAKAGLIGRRKAAELRLLFAGQGWLDPAQPLPGDSAIAAALAKPLPEVCSGSSVLPYQEQIRAWHEQGVQGVAIHQALVRKFAFTGHYSSVRRFLQKIERKSPKPTVILDFQPGGKQVRDHQVVEPGDLHLVLRDDALLEPPSVRRDRPRPDGRHLARLPPQGVRVVQRRSLEDCDR